MRVDGTVKELWHELHEGERVELLTFADEDGKRTMRHTASHVLAQAVKHLRPETKLAIGPAIDNGFYYDFDADEPFTPEFLREVEKEMRKSSRKMSVWNALNFHEKKLWLWCK